MKRVKALLPLPSLEKHSWQHALAKLGYIDRGRCDSSNKTQPNKTNMLEQPYELENHAGAAAVCIRKLRRRSDCMHSRSMQAQREYAFENYAGAATVCTHIGSSDGMHMHLCGRGVFRACGWARCTGKCTLSHCLACSVVILLYSSKSNRP